MKKENTIARPEKKMPSKHEVKSTITQQRICDAATRCLDIHGYAETTLSRIQAEANVSRGALMYHFADRNEIVAATAVQLLKQSVRPIERRARQPNPSALRELLEELWKRVVDTAGGRAMLEILVACRTDVTLKSKLEAELLEWDRTSLETIGAIYVGTGADSDDAEVLWSIARSFVRGLIVHQEFVGSKDYVMRMLLRFTEILDPHLEPRDESLARSAGQTRDT